MKFAGNEKDKIGDDTYRSGGYTYNYSQIVSDLTADMNGLKNKVSKLKAAGATRADNGFNLAAKMMGSARTDAKKVVIFSRMVRLHRLVASRVKWQIRPSKLPRN